MRKIAAFCTVLMTAAVLQAPAQEMKKETAAPPQSPRATAKNDFAEVSYGQPSKRGREIFGTLVKYGEVWRTGANASTDITFNADVLVDGKEIKKGTYAVFTIPQEKEWTVIFNSKPGQKGAFEYDANKDKNVLEVKAPVEHTKNVQEKLTISFEKGYMVFNWDTTKVKVSLKKK